MLFTGGAGRAGYVAAMTLISTTTLLPGQSVRVDVDAQPDGGAVVAVSVADPELRVLDVGIEGPNGAETQAQAAAFREMAGARDFGIKWTGEPLPSLTGHGVGKLKDLPRTCEPWCSFKQWNESRVTAWMTKMPAVDLSYATYKLTYHHEPHGDAGMTPTIYRPRLARVIQIVNAHPNAGRITGIGPIVTGYWLRERGGNPLDWWVDGAKVYGVDCYDPPEADHNWTPSEMFDPVLERLYAALPDDVEIAIPEWGRWFVKGQARADAIEADLEHLRTQHPRVKRVNYYCNPVLFPQFTFGYNSPEAEVLRKWMAKAPARQG